MTDSGPILVVLAPPAPGRERVVQPAYAEGTDSRVYKDYVLSGQRFLLPDLG